jgi:flagellar biosynthetic protein FliR
MIDWSQLTLFLYITARMSGFVLFNPVIGRRSIPSIFRAGFVLVLSVFVASTTTATASEPIGLIDCALHLILELAVGFLVGIIVNFFFYIPQLAGFEIDTQMGMTMNQTYDAGAQANMSVTAEILNILMTLLFFIANGHHTLLRIMLTSGDIVAYGGASISSTAVGATLELFAECTVLAVKLCMPVLGAELVGQLGMGILMKVIPQINVFSINIELKVIIGLSMLLMLMAPFGEYLLTAESTMLDSISQVLTLL